MVRNDEVTVDEIVAMKPERLVISPGPCTPTEAGISCEVDSRLGPTMPPLGVCLGHQSIGQVYGGRVVRAGRLMHGKTSLIRHTGHGVLAGMPNPFEAIRYHSLLVERASLPADLEITAETDEGEIMGLQHRQLSRLRRAVPPGVHPHAERQADPEELSGHVDEVLKCAEFIRPPSRKCKRRYGARSFSSAWKSGS